MTDQASAIEQQGWDLLLLTVTPTEEAQLLRAAEELSIPREKRMGHFKRGFYDFGRLGGYRVAAVCSREGALGYGGSASAAQIYQAETRATGIIAVGMAFGISREQQKIGDVLVSEGLFPYDDRLILEQEGKPVYRYEALNAATGPVHDPAEGGRRPRQYAKFRQAKPSLLKFFRAQAKRQRTNEGPQIHVGALLSGNARIRSAAYRDMLYEQLATRRKSIVGGEMEAVGLLSCSDPDKPWWIVVKGICDFADAGRDADIVQAREPACHNAARFVLASLKQAKQADSL